MEFKKLFSFLVRPLKMVTTTIEKPIVVMLSKFKPSTKFVINNDKGIDKLLRENATLKVNRIRFKTKIAIRKDKHIINIDFKDCLKEQSIQFREILKGKQAEIKQEILDKINNKKTDEKIFT